MKASEALLAEFDQEMASTRTTLERVPEDKFDYKPHPKSGSMIWLAAHVAMIPGWAKVTLEESELNMEGMQPPPLPKTREELLKMFDENAAGARAAIAAASDEALAQTWTLRVGEQVFFSMPRAAVMRGMIMNHLIHHRAQLTVYLRMNDIPVPALYGPSADEGTFPPQEKSTATTS